MHDFILFRLLFGVVFEFPLRNERAHRLFVVGGMGGERRDDIVVLPEYRERLNSDTRGIVVPAVDLCVLHARNRLFAVRRAARLERAVRFERKRVFRTAHERFVNGFPLFRGLAREELLRGSRGRRIRIHRNARFQSGYIPLAGVITLHMENFGAVRVPARGRGILIRVERVRLGIDDGKHAIARHFARRDVVIVDLSLNGFTAAALIFLLLPPLDFVLYDLLFVAVHIDTVNEVTARRAHYHHHTDRQNDQRDEYFFQRSVFHLCFPP